MIVVHGETVVLEVLFSFAILHARHIEHVCDAEFEQFSDVEGRLDGADEDARRDLC